MKRILIIFSILMFGLFGHVVNGSAKVQKTKVYDLTMETTALSGDTPFVLNDQNGVYTIDDAAFRGPNWTLQINRVATANAESAATFYVYYKSSVTNYPTAWTEIDKTYLFYNIALDSGITVNPKTFPVPPGNFVRFYLENNGISEFNAFEAQVITGQDTPIVDPGWIATTYSDFGTSGTTGIYDQHSEPLYPPEGSNWVALGPSGASVIFCFNGADDTPSTSKGQTIKVDGELIIPVMQYLKGNWTTWGTFNGTLKLDWYNYKPF